MTATEPIVSKAELFRMALRERSDPESFYRALSYRTVDELPFELNDRTVLDLGYGTGHNGDALRAAGAQVIGVDIERGDFQPTVPVVTGDALRLPFADESFDGVFSSNMLEHVPDPAQAFAEIERVLQPGGWAWVSFTNWFSPWGGHNITPLHYLGPERGVAVWTRLFGAPTKNLPGIGLFPTHIGDMIALLEQWPTLELEDVYPRYYRSQRWLMKVPAAREFLSWNCVLVFRRR